MKRARNSDSLFNNARRLRAAEESPYWPLAIWKRGRWPSRSAGPRSGRVAPRRVRAAGARRRKASRHGGGSLPRRRIARFGRALRASYIRAICSTQAREHARATMASARHAAPLGARARRGRGRSVGRGEAQGCHSIAGDGAARGSHDHRRVCVRLREREKSSREEASIRASRTRAPRAVLVFRGDSRPRERARHARLALVGAAGRRHAPSRDVGARQATPRRGAAAMTRRRPGFPDRRARTRTAVRWSGAPDDACASSSSNTDYDGVGSTLPRLLGPGKGPRASPRRSGPRRGRAPRRPTIPFATRGPLAATMVFERSMREHARERRGRSRWPRGEFGDEEDAHRVASFHFRRKAREAVVKARRHSLGASERHARGERSRDGAGARSVPARSAKENCAKCVGSRTRQAAEQLRRACTGCPQRQGEAQLFTRPTRAPCPPRQGEGQLVRRVQGDAPTAR